VGATGGFSRMLHVRVVHCRCDSLRALFGHETLSREFEDAKQKTRR
jgi:hypothetical protein